MKLQGYKLNIKSVKKEILRMWNETPVKDRPTICQGLLSAKIATRYFNPDTEQKEYAEIYKFIFELLTKPALI